MSFADNTFTPRRQRRTSDPEERKREMLGTGGKIRDILHEI